MATDEDATTMAASEALFNALRNNKDRVIDIFLKLDADMSGAIDKKEFRQILIFAKDATLSVDTSTMDACFDLLDQDGSGTIELKELERLLRVGYAEVLARKLQVGAAGEIVLKAENEIQVRKGTKSTAAGTGGYSHGCVSGGTGTGTSLIRTFRGGNDQLLWQKEGAQTISNSHRIEVDLGLDGGDTELTPELAESALRQALTDNAVRVIDLFRDWDVNGDGEISAREFVTGVKLLGLPGGQAAAQLFRAWDDDGSGSLQIAELNKVLRRGNGIKGLPPKVDYCVTISSRRNWSRRKVDGASGVVLHVPKDSSLMRNALRTRPAAASAHEAWRTHTAASGRTSPLMPQSGGKPAKPDGAAGKLGRTSPQRSSEQILADLASPTATARERTRGRQVVAGRPRVRSAGLGHGLEESAIGTGNSTMGADLPLGAATFNATYTMRASASTGSLSHPIGCSSDPLSSPSSIGYGLRRGEESLRGTASGGAPPCGELTLATSMLSTSDTDAGPHVNAQRGNAGVHVPRIAAAPTNSTSAAGTTTGVPSPGRAVTGLLGDRSLVKGVMPTASTALKNAGGGGRAHKAGRAQGQAKDYALHHGYYHNIPAEAAGFFGTSAKLTPRGSAYLEAPTPLIDGNARNRSANRSGSGSRARTPLYDAYPPSTPIPDAPFDDGERQHYIDLYGHGRAAQTEGGVYSKAAREKHVKAGRRKGATGHRGGGATTFLMASSVPRGEDGEATKAKDGDGDE